MAGLAPAIQRPLRASANLRPLDGATTAAMEYVAICSHRARRV